MNDARRTPPRVAQSPLGAFSPGQTDPGRRAKLVALAPRLDDYYRAKLAEVGATGAVVGIVLDGELVYAQGFGVRDVQTRASVDIDTQFRLGSLTKSFTAAAVLQLRDEGRIALDAPAQSYLPELKSAPDSLRDVTAITPRQLLTMTSGLPHDDMWGAVTFGYSDAQLMALLEGGLPLGSPPGQTYAYSNLGYAILGKIVERVSGLTARAYITTHILRPLGMTSSGWTEGELSRVATGYHRQHEQLRAEPRPDDGVFATAGGLYSSMRDYARYMAFQLAAYPPREGPETGPLRRSTRREMHTGHAWLRWDEDVPVASRGPDGRLALSAASYGFGWVNNTTCAYEGIVQHGGYEPGYYAYVRLLPQHGLGLAIFSTTASFGDYKSFEGALGLLRGAGVVDTAPAAVPPALREASTTINELLRSWDQALFLRTFDAQSVQYSWLSTLGEDFARLKRDHGACELDGALNPSGAARVGWRMACERGALRLTVWLTPTRPPRIQSMQWKEESATSPGTQATGRADASRPCSE
ncbi:MAG TPA: serine hydrolase domain-containing protein [Polyangiaceae bacterium]|nr:serine hydrolase domain-containing protein [Polyangiaceae bacterium]